MLLLPLLRALAIIVSLLSRHFANALFFACALLGVWIIFNSYRNKSMLRVPLYSSLLWLLTICFFSLYSFLSSVPLKEFYFEGRYLLLFPFVYGFLYLFAGHGLGNSFRLFCILLFSNVTYLFVSSGFSFRFAGADSIFGLKPWVPTLGMALLFVLLAQQKFANRFFFFCQLVSSAVLTSFIALSASIGVEILISSFRSLISKKTKLVYLLLVCSLFLLVASTPILFAVRGRDIYDFAGLDRVVFYNAFIKYWSQSGLTNLLFGSSPGASALPWIDNLPTLFRNFNLAFVDRINTDSAFVLQIDLLRVLYSYGLIGFACIFHMFLVSLRSCCAPNNAFLGNTRPLLIALLASSLLTITISTPSVLIVFLFCFAHTSEKARLYASTSLL